MATIVERMELTLRERLKRLGVQKGAGGLKLKSDPPPVALPARIEAPEPTEALWNVEPPTNFGPARIRRSRFSLAHVHGDRPLNQASEITFRNVALRNALYLDTETTGLQGGAGTLAFMVGAGYFDADEFIVDQYFLRDPADELAMLAHLDARVARQNALVSFNGKAFDVPLLETRFTLGRIAPQFRDRAHLDLLMPSRQVWRGALTDCRLGTLEFHLLGVRRDQQDIAGFLIPQLYREYLQAGSPAQHAEMQRVMYHNLHDILSMVTLATRLADAFERPASAEERFAVASQFEREGDLARATQEYARTIDQVSQGSLRPTAVVAASRARLANALKRQQRTDEAVEHWQMLAIENDVPALIELAMHYEWRERDPAKALTCAERALLFAATPVLQAQLRRRCERLRAKVGRQATSV